MKVLCYGGRDFDDYEGMAAFLSAEFPFEATLIHGNARGADRLSERWYRSLGGVDVEVFNAEWKKFGKGAGAIRNQRMLAEGKPDLAIEFPGGRGTADMRARLVRAGVPIKTFTNAALD